MVVKVKGKWLCHAIFFITQQKYSFLTVLSVQIDFLYIRRNEDCSIRISPEEFCMGIC